MPIFSAFIDFKDNSVQKHYELEVQSYFDALQQIAMFSKSMKNIESICVHEEDEIDG